MTDINEAFYALPATKQFPLDTCETTESSYGAYKMLKSAFSAEQQAKIEANFEKAASFYGIELEKAAPEPEKREEIFFKGASEDVAMTEVLTEDELWKAADYLMEKRASCPRENLAEAAKYLVWQASNAGIPLDSDKMVKISHIAGIGVGDREAIQYEFEKRGALYPLAKEGRDAFWKYARELKSLSDEDFYTEENLNAVCNVMDSMDFMYRNQHKHASELGYPEDVVFNEGIDDLLKQASDLYTNEKADITLSKTATLERKDKINAFFRAHYADYTDLDGEDLFNKLASLDPDILETVLENIE